MKLKFLNQVILFDGLYHSYFAVVFVIYDHKTLVKGAIFDFVVPLNDFFTWFQVDYVDFSVFF